MTDLTQPICAQRKDWGHAQTLTQPHMMAYEGLLDSLCESSGFAQTFTIGYWFIIREKTIVLK